MREERTCGECDLGKVEDVQYSLFTTNRQTLFSHCQGYCGMGFDLMTDDEKLFTILDQG